MKHEGSVIADHVARGHPPGAVVLWARGDDVVVNVYGARTIGGAPMTRHTIFRIASLTKPITAVAALGLVDGGILQLDDSIESWLPELADRRVLARPDGPLDQCPRAARWVKASSLIVSSSY